MHRATNSRERLLEFVKTNHDGRQKNFADHFGVSPSQVSGWLNQKSESIPLYMIKIIDLTDEVNGLRSREAETSSGRIISESDGYAIVRFPEDGAPGMIVCRGVPDVETAKTIAEGLATQPNTKNATEQKVGMT